MPRMGIKNILFMEEKIFTIEEQYSITTGTTRFMLRRPLRCVLRVQEAIVLPKSWFGGRGPIRG